MVYTGIVENGVVRLNNGQTLADGTLVRVEMMERSSEPNGGGYEDLLALAGSVKGLPADFAENHDHYIHGHPKE